MKPTPLLIRADASLRMGTGHIMRMIALGQAWRNTGGRVAFACSEITPALRARLDVEGFELHHLDVSAGTPEDAAVTILLAQNLSETFPENQWVSADGYLFGADYQRTVKSAGLRLLLVDDYGHAEHYFADLVLNQNLSASEDLYKNREPYTRLLLGTCYVLLRKEFLAYREWQRTIPSVARKILVTLGGSDPDNVTGKVIEALKQIPEIETKIVIGGSNPHREQLQSEISNQRSAIELLVDVINMPALMAWADVAVAAGGSTSWELAFMGLPSLSIILADNQKEVAKQLEIKGASVNLGHFSELPNKRINDILQSLILNPVQRNSMNLAGRSMVDGIGADRVLREVNDQKILLRFATPLDCRMVWEWANDSDVRAESFNTSMICWEAHQQWFDERLNDPNCMFYIAEKFPESAIGQVRFQINEKEAIVSISLDRHFRGLGYASVIIREATLRLFQKNIVNTIHAYVKPGNAASLRSFQKAGYIFAGESLIGSHPAVELVFHLP